MSTTEHVFGLSFLETLKPEDVQSPRIIGYLPASEGGQLVEAGLNDFRENCESAEQRGSSSLMFLSGSGI